MIADTYTKPTAAKHVKRDAVYEFVQAYIAKNDVPPTMREIGEGVGLRSANSVSHHLNQLVKAELFEKRLKGNKGSHHLYLPSKAISK